jgi:penicillin-binding protein 1C
MNKNAWFLLLLLPLGTGFWFALPRPLFSDPLSTVVFDRNGELAGARISADGQWRFPLPDSIPENYRTAAICFEDRWFDYHPGVNPLSLGRAMVQNIRSREIVSGGSTISMQVIRLARKGKPRTLAEKMVEMTLALSLELRYTKDEIFRFYSGHAPYGGNVVGLEAASWRYFGRDPFHLSWAETATLAVLPNSPALIHPGRNRELLKLKRNRLLYKLLINGSIDSVTYSLSLTEELPLQPSDLPSEAYHLTERFFKENPGERINSSLDLVLQRRVNAVVGEHAERLGSNQVKNASCLVMEVATGEVLAYVGNIRLPGRGMNSADVDIVPAPRSTGSILKPLLYAEMLHRGALLPDALVPDIPTRYRDYHPKNFDKSYDGAVPASEALSRSLNVPAVRMLNDYGTARFLNDLRELGFRNMNWPAGHYGLSLILGGAESSLWELAGVYSSMARVLLSYAESSGRYHDSDWRMPYLVKQADGDRPEALSGGKEEGKLGAGAIWLTFEALRTVKRPPGEAGWEYFETPRRVAWKTGTSFGYRDAWAIGTTPEYLVAVWAGNADGEGRQGLTGANSAAPLLFDLMNLLPATGWFAKPYDDLQPTLVCRESGFKAGIWCTGADTLLVTPAGLIQGACPFHYPVTLTADRRYRARIGCAGNRSLINTSWFVLPPAQEWYYRKKNPTYKPLPPLLPSCSNADEFAQIQCLYPDPGTVLLIPVELDGRPGKAVFEAVHRYAGVSIFWHLDDTYMGRTRDIHQLALRPDKGKHILVLVDEAGHSLRVGFEVE